MAVSAYASTTDLSGYLRDVSSSANSSIWTVFLNAASRFIDNKLGTFFYDDGQYETFWDGQGDGHIDTGGQHPFFGSSGTIGACAQGATSLTYTASQLAGRAPAVNDVFTLDIGTLKEQVTVSVVTGTGPYTLTVSATAHAHAASTLATTIAIRLLYFENQPLAQSITNLDGDGVTPGTNFFLWPRNRPRIGAANTATDTTSRRPWYGLDIARIPVSGTSYLPSSIPGYLTVGVNAHWGWPVVPDEIRDLTCKLSARAWRARDSGWSKVLGATEIGVVKLLETLDTVDEFTLLASDYNQTLW